SGLGSIAIWRLQFAVLQVVTAPAVTSPAATSPEVTSPGLPSAPKPSTIPIMASRRRLEHAMILPEIAARPLAGSGVGASYAIPGDAVMHGPKGRLIDHHYIHDVYLQVAFRLGVPALVLLAAMLLVYFRGALRALIADTSSPETTALTAGLISA